MNDHADQGFDWERQWHHETRMVLAVLLADARSGVLEADWRTSWTDRTAEALRCARAGRPGRDTWRNSESARHIVAVHAKASQLYGFDSCWLHSPLASTLDLVMMERTGEHLMLVLRELAAIPEGWWWDWEPAGARSASPARALRAWWLISLDVIDGDETDQLRTLTVMPEQHGSLDDVMETATRGAEIRAAAQQRRDLLTESVSAAGSAMLAAGLVRNLGRKRLTPSLQWELDADEWTDWVEASRRRVTAWRNRRASTEHLEKLADPAYRAELEQIPEYWL